MAKEKRKPISTKTRFDIFKRDGFKCQYCGKGTPAVTLEVDHIIPVNNGGQNNIDNLITACFECNRGKGKNELTQIVETIEEKSAKMLEKEMQYKAFKKMQAKIENRMQAEIQSISALYTEFIPEFELNENFKASSLRKFISELGILEVEISMRQALSKGYDENRTIKYFCGICWNKIKGVTYG